jgi:hypothetical protein
MGDFEAWPALSPFLAASKGAKVAAYRTGRSAAGPRDGLTLLAGHFTVKASLMSAPKIQIGQLWKQDGTGEIYLVTRLYSEALYTMVILRKSGAEEQAQMRVKVERAAGGQTIPGFTPAQEDEKF